MTPSFLISVLEHTRDRVRARREAVSEAELIEQIGHAPTPRDFRTALRPGPRATIIAEIKRSSPTFANIATHLDPVDIARSYQRAGAAAISVLTEPVFFNGQIEDLANIRRALPAIGLLLKDFVFDDYQILEARAFGADAVLLIHALLGSQKLRALHRRALDLGLSPLVEVNSAEEFADAMNIPAALIAINNRNLDSLTVDLEVSRRLAGQKRTGVVLISASGIETSEQISQLQALGFDAFLVGTSLMRKGQPAESLKQLLDSLGPKV